MHHRLLSLHRLAVTGRHLISEEFVALILAAFVLIAPVAASTRFIQRGLMISNPQPGATNVTYDFYIQYASPDAVGSVDMLFCRDPIPDDPCNAPVGLDVSHAVLSDQSGETGFSILSKSPNHIILTRTPTPITSTALAEYTFTGITNPTDTQQSFSARLKSLGSADGTGQQIDFGSVLSVVSNPIVLETQVPPMLLFCAAGQVADDCTSSNEDYYKNLGQLSATSTLSAESQIVVGTNASGGFAITAVGTPMAAGTNVIDALTTPTPSKQGTNQFGINLVANNTPNIGSDPEGDFTNANPTADYDTPNMFKFNSGDVIATSPNVSLMRKFTVTYVVNSSKDLRAGVYTTSMTYIASGRF